MIYRPRASLCTALISAFAAGCFSPDPVGANETNETDGTGSTSTDGSSTEPDGEAEGSTETDNPMETTAASETSAPEVSVFCADLDRDGFGDPNTCEEYDSPPANYIEDDTDCDDGDARTFPGAAVLENGDACMTDADDDDWGDVSAPAAGSA
ncbi:MAG: hypothetical protein KUG77_25645, partial [Nannocystaceae bacterium]|nr:hypothetical protein [Nannocystaceae bacterium]